MDSRSTAILAIAAVVAGGIGYGGGMMTKQVKVDETQSQLNSVQSQLETKNQKVQSLQSEVKQAELNTNSPAADLRVSMNGLLKEHVDLGLIALRNAYDGAPDTQASVQQLDQNSQEIAGTVGSVYGDEAEQQFLELWRSHINDFVMYTEGLKADNQTKMERANESLKQYAQSAGEFFSNANPNIPKRAVVSLAEEHKKLVIASMEAYDEGNYEKAYRKEREANKQVSKIADALSGGIVKQYPENFRPEN